jgi:serine/threonine-protein kinase
MSSSTVLRAFLFTDIVEATALKQRIGDARGAQAIEAHDQIFRDCLKHYGGEEQENPGDGFFASFDLPSDALRCALAFVHRMSENEITGPLRVRVGVHMGETVLVTRGERDGKLLGLAIDTTARVMSLAIPSQILLTRHAFDSVRQQVVETEVGRAVTWLAHGQYRFKGVEDALEIFEAGVQDVSPLAPPPDTDKARRVLAAGEEETLGWRPAAGLMIPGRESWELDRKIGAGAFGEVWLARHRETQYVRTFKFCQDAQHLRSLKREQKLFRLMAEVLGDRPDIARLYEVRLQEPPYYLEMEYTAGGNLEEWSEKQGGVARVSLAARIELMAQVGEALAAAHTVGVIHKDIKPTNVLIHEERDGRLQVRLTDFGIGELLDTGKAIDLNMSVTVFVEPLAKTESYNSMSGTRLYMAPELLTGEQASTRTDVFALGVLLFQVVVGDLKRSVAHGWEQYVDDEILRDDIAACIAGTPSDRLASPAILSERLRTLDRRRQERETERRAAVGNARRQRLLRVTTIATLLFMLVAGITGTLLWRSEQARRDAVEETRRATIAMEQALADSEWARRRLEQQLHKSEP